MNLSVTDESASNAYLPSDIEAIVSRLADVVPCFVGKTVVIAGAKGFLGRYFIEVFKKMNESCSPPVTVVGLDNFVSSGALGTNFDDDIGDWWSFHEIDLGSSDSSLEFIKSADFVIHAAGIASPFYYRAKPLQTLDVAINGSRTLLDLALKHSARYTFFSSSEIYGDPDPKKVPIEEDYRGNVSTLGPRSCYDESKRAGETLCYIYEQSFNVHTNIIRPFNVYGPGMQATDYRVMPNFASEIQKGNPLNVYGSGGQTRTFCYIEDAMVGFFMVIASGMVGEAYNIGNDIPEITIADLAEMVAGVDGKGLKTQITEYPDTYPGDEPERRCPDLNKAKALGYTPSVELEEGVRRFLSWAAVNF